MKIVLATKNPGKVNEIKLLLENLPITLIPASNLHIPPYSETALTFVENALGKARWASQHTKHPAIADDSGLCVDALNGAPGIYSSRYAGANATAEDNINKLLETLKNIPGTHRKAYFHCAIVLVRHENDPTPLICQAQWEGIILNCPKGKNGFGYDPIFYLPDLKKTSAELSQQEKNQISARGKALAQLVKVLKHISSFEDEFPHTIFPINAT